jgi:EAL domain-containing protein (putative c-di-GMP-specific phosphodiesterase class I)
LEEAGIAVALDDFGSGVCSLRHLTDFPIAMVKLDELVTMKRPIDGFQEIVEAMHEGKVARGVLEIGTL